MSILRWRLAPNDGNLEEVVVQEYPSAWWWATLDLMNQHEMRQLFESLLARNHVERAMIRLGTRTANCTPIALSTVMLLGGTTDQLQDAYDVGSPQSESWPMSPDRIVNVDQRQARLGDIRYQRAYMDYFSMQNGILGGNSRQLVTQQLLVPDEMPLLHGHFVRLGQPMIQLSDAFEARSSILVVEALTLSAADWSPAISDILSFDELPAPEVAVSPESILAKIAYDGRFSGLMKNGAGYGGLSLLLSDEATRTAICDYLYQLDLSYLPKTLAQLSELSIMLLCGTHKPNRPAFDFYLSSLPTIVNALTVLLPIFDGNISAQETLVRGVWLLFILVYITQLRPVIDSSLVTSAPLTKDDSWDLLLAECRNYEIKPTETGRDIGYLRCVRSLRQLASSFPEKDPLCRRAAWKLRRHWTKWVGLGQPREETLNIRL